MQSNMDQLILSALREDIPYEDISTNSVIKSYVKGNAHLLCKQDGIIAGLSVFERVFLLLDGSTKIRLHCKDGNTVNNGELIAEIVGDVRVILSGERTALNYLQRMSGIATHTRRLVNLLEGSQVKLLDTRKTTPNNRIFEKHAVRAGGGFNHRFSLSDGIILLKDNHIVASGGIKQAVALAREYAPFVHKIEVEVEDFDMLLEALEARADIVMLDNMSIEEMKEAVKIVAKKALIECSGNITIENIGMLKDIGVDYISSGALTHSSSILDFSLNLKMI